ncbi:phage-shock protein [Shewanella mangrovi]|uniref:Phage-shock protein n=1 Tax=Shewanella mangrovi TaxID=1515746 RepID=A0A094J999_9GAMM|nr:PspC domain-containing protein [Shewanella mangrovi]KFZ36485.1 phage-shock protein [Shewanella mangrovi]
MEDNHNINTLTRGETGLIAGVCSGMADYYGIRKNGLRLAFLITSFFFGIPIVAYIVLWLILPKYPSSQAMARQLRRKAEQRRGI